MKVTYEVWFGVSSRSLISGWSTLEIDLKDNLILIITMKGNRWRWLEFNLNVVAVANNNDLNRHSIIIVIWSMLSNYYYTYYTFIYWNVDTVRFSNPPFAPSSLLYELKDKKNFAFVFIVPHMINYYIWVPIWERLKF